MHVLARVLFFHAETGIVLCSSILSENEHCVLMIVIVKKMYVNSFIWDGMLSIYEIKLCYMFYSPRCLGQETRKNLSVFGRSCAKSRTDKIPNWKKFRIDKFCTAGQTRRHGSHSGAVPPQITACAPQTRIVNPSEDCAPKKVTGSVPLECSWRSETPKILVITP